MTLAETIDKPAGALALGGAGFGLSEFGERLAALDGALGPLAGLGGKFLLFLVISWWIRKWWRVMLGREAGDDEPGARG